VFVCAVDVVIDSSRSPVALFALSRRAIISVYSLGKSGGTECVFRCKHENLLGACMNTLGAVRAAAMGASGAPVGLRVCGSVRLCVCMRSRSCVFVCVQHRLTDDWDPKRFRVISIHAIPRSESESVHLIATTERGHRIYMSVVLYYSLGISSSYDLRVRYVRLCPPHVMADAKERDRALAPNTKSESPQQVRKAFYAGGVLLLADARRNQTTDGDTLSNDRLARSTLSGKSPLTLPLLCRPLIACDALLCGQSVLCLTTRHRPRRRRI
jgi:hypothetical protein